MQLVPRVASSEPGSVDSTALDQLTRSSPPEITLVLTPHEKLRDSLNEECFAHFVEAVYREVQHWHSHETAPPAHLQIGCALLPGEQSLIELQFHTESAGTDCFRRLHDQLCALDVPPDRKSVV